MTQVKGNCVVTIEVGLKVADKISKAEKSLPSYIDEITGIYVLCSDPTGAISSTLNVSIAGKNVYNGYHANDHSKNHLGKVIPFYQKIELNRLVKINCQDKTNDPDVNFPFGGYKLTVYLVCSSKK